MGDTKMSHAEQNAKAGYENIAAMVASLEADRDLLEVLRDERDGFEIENPAACDETIDGTAESVAAWAAENPDDAEELKKLEEAVGEWETSEDVEQAIVEDPLSIEVRSGWVTLGSEMTADEFSILLTTGGPALRIRGELDNGEPTRAWLEYQDWGTPWTQYFDAEQDTLLTYCRHFYFGG
jgi:hypothetical protein